MQRTGGVRGGGFGTEVALLHALALLVVVVVAAQVLATLRIYGARTWVAMRTMWQLGRSIARDPVPLLVLAFSVSLGVSTWKTSSIESLALALLLALSAVWLRCAPPHVLFLGQSGQTSEILVSRLTWWIIPFRLVHLLATDSSYYSFSVLASRQSLRRSTETRWEPVVIDLVRLTCVVIFDARVETPGILSEGLFTVSEMKGTTKFIIVEASGQGRVIDQFLPAALRAHRVEIVTVEQLLRALRALGVKAALFGTTALASERSDHRGGHLQRLELSYIPRQCSECGSSMPPISFDWVLSVAPKRSVMALPGDEPWDPRSIVAWQCVRCGSVLCNPCAGFEVDRPNEDHLSINVKCRCSSLDFRPGICQIF